MSCCESRFVGLLGIISALDLLQVHDAVHTVLCLLSGASNQAGHVFVDVADGPSNN